MKNGKYSVDWLKGDLHPTPPVVNIIIDDESENQSQTVEASDVDGEETPSQRLQHINMFDSLDIFFMVTLNEDFTGQSLMQCIMKSKLFSLLI